MEASVRGTFVISWTQTEIDGLEGAPIHALDVGAVWVWRGDAVCVDGPGGLLRLGEAEGEADLRRRAARSVRRLAGTAVSGRSGSAPDAVLEGARDTPDGTFVVTDGARIFTVTVIETGSNTPPLLMFLDTIPPRGCALWVVRHALKAGRAGKADHQGGLICFTAGTMIDTDAGPRPVEHLRTGDRVLTRDDGAREILWTGSRRVTGARMLLAPEMRPIRFLPGALGERQPDRPLSVSPGHRLLVKDPAADALFGTPEVLVAARDLLDLPGVAVEAAAREVRYVHVLLRRHQILRANGVEAESFHPASTALSALEVTDRARLLARFPELEADPHSYGAFARRNLSRPEAAIMLHEAA